MNEFPQTHKLNRAEQLRTMLTLAVGSAVLVGCGVHNTPDKPKENPLTGAYVTQQAGRFYLDLCFKKSNGALETIDLGASNSFYAGSSRITVYPKLVQKSLPNQNVTTAFGSKQSTTVPEILNDIQDGTLTPYEGHFKNANVDLDCQKDFPGTLSRNFVNNIDEVQWNGIDPHLLGAPSFDGTYSDGVPFEQIILPH